MPSFSKRSRLVLDTVHPDLQQICEVAIELVDFAAICGHRTQEEQEQAVANGFSKTHWPHSPHNEFPSHAVDLVPSPIDWKDRERFCFLAGVIKALAHMYGVKVKWGGDWNGNGVFSDESFSDLPHFELVIDP